MPPKHEHVLTCNLSRRQRALYDEYMGRSETRSVMSGGNFMGVINVLMQLRKVRGVVWWGGFWVLKLLVQGRVLACVCSEGVCARGGMRCGVGAGAAAQGGCVVSAHHTHFSVGMGSLTRGYGRCVLMQLRKVGRWLVCAVRVFARGRAASLGDKGCVVCGVGAKSSSSCRQPLPSAGQTPNHFEPWLLLPLPLLLAVVCDAGVQPPRPV